MHFLFCMNTFSTHTTDLAGIVIVKCKGRLVQSESAYHLRNVVQTHTDAKSIVLDFAETKFVAGGGLGMLAFLHRWAAGIGIHLVILNPTSQVKEVIQHFSEDT